MVDAGFVVCGDPDDLIAQIARLEEQTGGFGAFLVTPRLGQPRGDASSYDLIRRYVMPALPGAKRLDAPLDGLGVGESDAVLAAATQSMVDAIQKDASSARSRRADASPEDGGARAPPPRSSRGAPSGSRRSRSRSRGSAGRPRRCSTRSPRRRRRAA